MICDKCKAERYDDICTLADYKYRLNEFYRDRYGGKDITDIMEAEMALSEGKTITIDETTLKINCSHHKGSEKVHS